MFSFFFLAPFVLLLYLLVPPFLAFLFFSSSCFHYQEIVCDFSLPSPPLPILFVHPRPVWVTPHISSFVACFQHLCSSICDS